MAVFAFTVFIPKGLVLTHKGDVTMTHIILENEKQRNFKKTMAKLMKAHPHITYLTMFVGVPLFIILSVFVFTSVVMLPISWLLGWI